jgi:4-hydroxyphenylpyruvate dioxygenase
MGGPSSGFADGQWGNCGRERRAVTANGPTNKPLRAHQHLAVNVIELWVGDLDTAALLLCDRFGFSQVGAKATSSGSQVADLRCGGVQLRLRQAGPAEDRVACHVGNHGDTVVDVALSCADADALAGAAAAHGLRVEQTPAGPKIEVLEDLAVAHTLHEGPRPEPGERADGLQMYDVDHITYCLPYGTASRVAEAYEAVFGLEQVDIGDFRDVGGVRAGMRSYVLWSPQLKVVLTEPLCEDSVGQTQAFLNVHGGPGLQHVAFSYVDLISAVELLRSRGVEFLSVPDQYFDQAKIRLDEETLPWEALRRLRILVDSDEKGLLLQLFTRPIFDRPTLFFELIQRMGSRGFGANNVRALFAAVEAASRNGVGQAGEAS